MSNVELPDIIGKTFVFKGNTIEEVTIMPRGMHELECSMNTYRYSSHRIRTEIKSCLQQAKRTQAEMPEAFRVPIFLTADSQSDFNLLDDLTDKIDPCEEFFCVSDQTYVIPEEHEGDLPMPKQEITHIETILYSTLMRYQNCMNDAALKQLLSILQKAAFEHYKAILPTSMDVHLVCDSSTMWNSLYNSFYTCNTELRRFFLALLYAYLPEKRQDLLVFNTDRIVHIGVPMAVHAVNRAVNALLDTHVSYRLVRNLPQHKNPWRFQLYKKHSAILQRLSTGLEDGSIYLGNM